MFGYVIRRLLWMIPSFFAISLVSFVIIHLPPGDFVTSYAADLATSGAPADETTLENLRIRYGLKDPLPVQYLRWVGNALQGDLGDSFEYRTPVANIIWGRLGMTALVAFCTLIFVWLVSFPIGIYSAVRQYSVGDYLVTFFSFLGMATPNFLLALFVMYRSAACSRPTSSMPAGAWRGSATCCIISGSRCWCWGSPASPRWSASCAPTC